MGNSASSNIWEASHNGQLELVRKLLDDGIDIDSQSPKGGYTALICAAAAGHVELIEFLIEEGADMSLKDDFGFTALTAAESELRSEVIDILESAMAISVRHNDVSVLSSSNLFIYIT